MTDTINLEKADDEDPLNTPKIAGALLRYRTLAWTTGIWLLALCAEIIARYGYDVRGFEWVGIVHGWVYFIYLILTADLAVKARWKPVHTILTLIAGTIPLLSFYAEHRNSVEVKREFNL